MKYYASSRTHTPTAGVHNLAYGHKKALWKTVEFLIISTLTGGAANTLSFVWQGLSVCPCAQISFTKFNDLFRWSASACFHCSSPVHQPPSQAEETTAAVASASNSHLPSPLNHFPIHCLQTHITQHPHRLLISEPTLREWTWPRKTGVCKQHHLTRQSLC